MSISAIVRCSSNGNAVTHRRTAIVHDFLDGCDDTIGDIDSLDESALHNGIDHPCMAFLFLRVGGNDNLGFIIKSTELLVFEDIIRAKFNA